mgnify:CR=1 FL=1
MVVAMVFLLYFAFAVGVLDLGEGIVVLAVPQGGQEVGGLEGEREAEGTIFWKPG